MAEPPPRDPGDPADDETVIVPPDRSVEETVISDGWGPESEVFTAEETVVEETEAVPPKRPLIWPWLLALLVAVLAGLGAYLYFTQQDESTVPAVTGMRQEAAEAAVRDAGLEPETTRQESSKPAGLVLGQSPDAGHRGRRGQQRPARRLDRAAARDRARRRRRDRSRRRSTRLDRGGLRVRRDGGVLRQEGRNRRLAEAGRPERSWTRAARSRSPSRRAASR